MTIAYPITSFAAADELVVAPASDDRRTRHFDLPIALHAVTVGLYFVFLGVMALAFQSQSMILPMAIFIIYIVMAFGVPALWARMKPVHDDHAMNWPAFEREGVVCATGRLTSGEAMGQVLILPVLIVGWAVVVAIIAAAAR
jgi:uncharacterized membrane protein YhaH (DUF805 family)